MTTSKQSETQSLSMTIRVLRSLGYGIVGIFVLGAMLMGADTSLAKSQFFLGIGGACLAIITMRFTQWPKSTSPTKRFAFCSFFGAVLGTLIATVVFGGWSLSDGVAAGLGAGVINGILITIGATVLRTASLSFSK